MGEPEIALAQVLVNQESWDKTKEPIVQESHTKPCKKKKPKKQTQTPPFKNIAKPLSSSFSKTFVLQSSAL